MAPPFPPLRLLLLLAASVTVSRSAALPSASAMVPGMLSAYNSAARTAPASPAAPATRATNAAHTAAATRATRAAPAAAAARATNAAHTAPATRAARAAPAAAARDTNAAHAAAATRAAPAAAAARATNAAHTAAATRAARAAAAATTATPSVQFYMLAVYWPQTSCEQHRTETGAGCRIPPTVDGWSLHGLWAQARPVHPQNCSGPALDLDELRPARAAMLSLWPEVYADNTAGVFWAHEWEKHGTCTVATGDADSQLDYFVRALELGVRYDPGVVLRAAGFEPRLAPYSTAALLAALTAALPRRAIVKCERLSGVPQPLLSEVRVCLDRRWRPADCYPADGTEIHSDGCDGETVLYLPLRHTPPQHWPSWLTGEGDSGERR